MRVLLIHDEARGFAGAEQMLLRFLDELDAQPDLETSLAAVRESPLGERLAGRKHVIWIPPKNRFSLRTLLQQRTEIERAARDRRFDLVHGWAARDWELTAWVGKRLGIPALGTLHDHPQARFHGRLRRALMKWTVRLGLDRVICVSRAVHTACEQCGYPVKKLLTVHNGLPAGPGLKPVGDTSAPLVLGFLGVFSRRKGLRELFLILDGMSRDSDLAWEMRIGGQAQDDEGHRLLGEVKREFGGRPWWSRVKWLGWMKDARSFFSEIQLLMVPSVEFDPFPTVLLEAGQSGVAAFAARRGGVPEIVVDGQTGWLFEPDQCEQAARLLSGITRNPEAVQRAGRAAWERVREEFAVGKMVAAYRRVYSTLISND